MNINSKYVICTVTRANPFIFTSLDDVQLGFFAPKKHESIKYCFDSEKVILLMTETGVKYQVIPFSQWQVALQHCGARTRAAL